jgi:hypothetical protein
MHRGFPTTQLRNPNKDAAAANAAGEAEIPTARQKNQQHHGSLADLTVVHEHGLAKVTVTRPHTAGHDQEHHAAPGRRGACPTGHPPPREASAYHSRRRTRLPPPPHFVPTKGRNVTVRDEAGDFTNAIQALVAKDQREGTMFMLTRARLQ